MVPGAPVQGLTLEKLSVALWKVCVYDTAPAPAAAAEAGTKTKTRSSSTVVAADATAAIRGARFQVGMARPLFCVVCAVSPAHSRAVDRACRSNRSSPLRA